MLEALFPAAAHRARSHVSSSTLRPSVDPWERWLRPVAWVLLSISGFAGTLSAQSEGVELIGRFDVGTVYNDVWGYSAPDGTELAILGSIDGTYFIDVTDPQDPSEVAFVPGARSTWRDMKTYGPYAYSVNETGGGIQVIDLRDPLEPVLANARFAQFETAHNIFVDEGAGTLWAVGANGVGLTNVFVYALEPDPSSPEYIASWGGDYLHDIFVRDGLAYGAALNRGELVVLDVSQLPIIEEIGSAPTPGAFTHNTWVTEDGRYCLTTDENSGGHVGVFEVSDPTAPELVGEWRNPDSPRSIVHNAFVHGGHAYVSWYTTGVQILDLSDPTTPTRDGFYDTYPGSGAGFDGAWGVYPFSRHGYTYVSDISSGLYVLRFDGARSRVEGRVRDAAGAPLAEVEVEVIGQAERTTTDDDGEFVLFLLPDSYELAFSRYGWETRTEPVVVAGPRVQLPDVVLEETPVGAIEGEVVDVHGRPLSDVRVRVVGASLETATDGLGRFRFERVAAGARDLLVHGFGIAGEPFPVEVRAGATAVANLSAFASILREDFEGEVDGWTVGSPGDAATSGLWERVTLDPSVDSAGQPTSDHSEIGERAFVTERGEPGSGAGEHDVDGGTTTLTSPRFDASSLARPTISFHLWYVNTIGLEADDEFVVEASPDGGERWVEIYRTGESDPGWRRVEIELGAEFSLARDLQLRFLASDLGAGSLVEAALDDLELFESEGRVSVQVLSAGDAPTLGPGRARVETTGEELTLDEEGRLQFLAPAGEVTFRVGAFGHEEATRTLELPARTTLRETVALIRLPYRRVAGTVWTDGDRVPLADARVECVGTPLVAVTDEAGRFDLELPYGDYVLRVEAEAFLAVERPLSVTEAGDPIDLDIEILPAFRTGTDPVAPNPSRRDTVLRFRLARRAEVQVEVFDLSGRRVRTLWRGPLGFGDHELRWDGRGEGGDLLPAGVYFQRFQADGWEDRQRVVRIR